MSTYKNEGIYVLVIEDDQKLRELLISRLTDQGYKVMAADNGAEAVECVQNSKFHVAISDLHMPGLDGIETLEAIKKADPKIQVIMTSGHGNKEAVVSAIKKGAFRFLHKPMAMNELYQLISKAYKAKPNPLAFSKLEILLETVMESLQVLFRADEGSFMLRDNNGNLYIACSRGLSEEIVYSTTLMLGERVAGLAVQERREFLINGGLETYDEFRGIEKIRRIRSSIVVPVCNNKQLIGVVNLNRTTNLENFTKEDQRGVSLFVSEIAYAVHEAKLETDYDRKEKSDSQRQTV